MTLLAALRVDPDRAKGRGYYLNLCWKLHATTDAGTTMEVGDGGAVNWTRTLLSDERERLAIGGLGVERLLAY